jgi:hypothetical protein
MAQIRPVARSLSVWRWSLWWTRATSSHSSTSHRTCPVKLPPHHQPPTHVLLKWRRHSEEAKTDQALKYRKMKTTTFFFLLVSFSPSSKHYMYTQGHTHTTILRAAEACWQLLQPGKQQQQQLIFLSSILHIFFFLSPSFVGLLQITAAGSWLHGVELLSHHPAASLLPHSSITAKH